MQPLYDSFPLANRPERPILHVRRMARRKPHARRLLRDGLQKVAEPLAFMPPGVHGLAEKRHVVGAALNEPLDLPDHTPYRPADHTSPHRRHYAITALVVAPGHDRDESAVLPLRSR